MNRLVDSLVLGIGVAVALIISYWMGQKAYSWMPPQATYEAERVDSLFSFLVALGSFVFLGVVGMISWAILTCRAKRGDFSEGHPSRGSAALEILWTLGPTLLVIWIAAQSQHIYQLLNLSGLNTIAELGATEVKAMAAPNSQSQLAQAIPAETIEVIAKQWAWTFRYPGGLTSDQLHLPVNQPARLRLESADVLHGFYMPAFRVKQDIIPNHKIDFTITPRQTGQYRLQDSQFSGTYFALMQADVYVESAEAYQQWLSKAAVSPPTLATNAAVMEHSASSQKLGSRWPSVAPATHAAIYVKFPLPPQLDPSSLPAADDPA